MPSGEGSHRIATPALEPIYASVNVTRRLRMRTIARLANVSVTTVSRVLNSAGTVCPEMTERVRAVINRTGYRPDFSARALVSGRSKTLGVVFSSVTDVPYFPELIQGFELSASELGYEMLVSYTHYDPHRLSRFLQRMVQRDVDGIAVMIFGIDNNVRERFSKTAKPVVFIDADPSPSPAIVLTVDYDVGMGEAMQHLVTLGHRHIGFVGGPTASFAAKKRLTAFLSSLGKFNLEANTKWILCGDHASGDGTAVVRRLFSWDRSPTAIICSNDITAVSLIRALFKIGMHVPRDISLIGFNDIHCARMIIPPLTTIELPSLEIASAAVKSLHAQVERTNGIVPELILGVRTKLVVRGSTDSPRALFRYRQMDG